MITVNFGSTSGYVSVFATDAQGCIVGPANLWVNVGPVGVGTVQPDDLSIYYSSGELHISSSSSKAQVKIFSTDGRLVFARNASNIVPLHIPNGIYVTEVLDNGRICRKKIAVIQQ
jgi:hypothetical protein